MEIIKTKSEIVSVLEKIKIEGEKIAFVPTMGALHFGHLQLIKQAKSIGDKVVCSIFVNPTQFNDPEDLKKYPRPIEQDITKLEAIGCDILFLPETSEIYAEDEKEWNLNLGILDSVLEGAHRPGHFQGVTQVVYKLFQILQPDFAIFGQKDLQQLRVIETMVTDLGLPVQIVAAPIVREDDGLAMSSRNVRLSEEGREQALALYKCLIAMQQAFGKLQINEGLQENPVKRQRALSDLIAVAKDSLNEAEGVELEYIEICDRDTLLAATEETPDANLIAVVAAWVSGIRLIDNMSLTETQF